MKHHRDVASAHTNTSRLSVQNDKDWLTQAHNLTQELQEYRTFISDLRAPTTPEARSRIEAYLEKEKDT